MLWMEVLRKKKKKEKNRIWMLQDLNVMMKDYMEGLSVKVFRTYNASVTLNRLLYEDTDSQEVVSHKADYDRANKEVCIPASEYSAKPTHCAFHQSAILACSKYRFLSYCIAGISRCMCPQP
jgi:hypothetical protein